MKTQAATKEQAVENLKMDQGKLDAHWEEMHSGDSNKPSLEDANAMLEQTVVEGDLSEATM